MGSMRCLIYNPVLLHGESAGFRERTMNKLMIACFTAAGLCGHLITANAATLENTTPVTPVTSSTTNRTTDLPYILAKLQGDVRTLQSEVQNLQSQKSQDPADPPESSR